jgi:hypothetical protein
MTRTGLAVVGYLVAVVLANLGAYHLGPRWVPAIGFVAIGFDLTCRDILHERWHGGDLKLNMALLIMAGSVLTKLANPAAAWVAIASMLAFGLSATVDSVIFEKLFHRARLVRINGSNLGSAAVDSVVFPTVAFGVFMPWIVAGQFLAKVAGGFVWSLVLTKGDRHATRDQ